MPLTSNAGEQARTAHLVKGASAAWGLVRKWFLLPLVGALLGAMLIGRITESFIGPSSYKVFVVGNFREGGVVAPQVLKGMRNAGATLGKIDGVDVVVDRSNDYGEASNAQLKATELAARSDTLLVVGHFSSTQTKAALPTYVRTATPKVPVILTNETNPTLLPPAGEGRYDPIFRLSATDDQQAKTAAAFAISHGATAFWVVEDVANPVYSSYLASKFSEEVLKSSQNVVLWTNNLSLPPSDAIKTLKINWVFFAGGWRDGLLLIRQLKATPGGQHIQVLLSDGAADKRLIEQGGTNVEGVYLTHPMRAANYNNAEGFSDYGANAAELITALLESSNESFDQVARRSSGFGYSIRKILGLHRVKDARNVLVERMNESTKQKESFALKVGESCVFQEDGVCSTAQFRIWQVKRQRFEDVQ